MKTAPHCSQNKFRLAPGKGWSMVVGESAAAAAVDVDGMK